MPNFDWALFITNFGFPIALVVGAIVLGTSILFLLIWPWFRDAYWPAKLERDAQAQARLDRDRQTFVDSLRSVVEENRAWRDQAQVEMRALWAQVAESDKERAIGRVQYLDSLAAITGEVKNNSSQQVNLLGEMAKSVRELNVVQAESLSVIKTISERQQGHAS